MDVNEDSVAWMKFVKNIILAGEVAAVDDPLLVEMLAWLAGAPSRARSGITLRMLKKIAAACLSEEKQQLLRGLSKSKAIEFWVDTVSD